MRTTLLVFSCLLAGGTAIASQPLETETARLLPAGVFKIEAAAEFQTSHEGTERAYPFVFEYGLTNKTEITIEPVLGTSIRPKVGTRANGIGDLEVTLTHLFLQESNNAPAFALAGEVKIPTARNRLIGTGKTDFTAWAIASKRLGRIDLHANLGYTIVGRPAGTSLSNIVDYALAEEFHVNPRWDVAGEVIGNTSSLGERGGERNAPVPGIPAEAAGSESSAMIGLRFKATPALVVSIGLSYDNNHAWLIRPGISWRFGGH